jgi:hypothetical protein
VAKGDGKYKWATGGKVHSISRKEHEQRVKSQRMLGGQSLTAPPSAAQAIREATSAADLQFGPQVQAATQMQANVAPWFADHIARVAGYAQAARELNAPILAQAQAYQQGAAAQTPPGLGPGSAAGQQATQAAQGRQSLAQLGLDALNTNAQATQDYFGGQQAMAARQQPQVQLAADQTRANAESQRGAAVQGFLTTARQNAQNYAIARGGLKLNTDKAAADATNDAANVNNKAAAITQAAKDKKAARAVTKRGQDISQKNAQDRQAAQGAEINKYGYSNAQWSRFSPSHRQRVMEAYNEKSGKGKGTDDKEATKHAAAVHAATGKVENTITDIIGAWNSYVGKKTSPNPDKPVNPETNPERPLTDADIYALVTAKNKAWTPQLIHIARLRKDGKKLDQASIDYLHNSDPNFRIPREWLPGDQRRGVTHPLDKTGSKNNPPSRTGAGDFK